tara:strand:+ start:364 stop:1449 length:1086 start_codon:yes stop_codon:yes gene_type:complete
MKKILISTGGSGGHIIPAIILYDHLKNKFNVEIVSDKRGSKFINSNLYPHKIIDTPKLSRNIIFMPFVVIFFLISFIKSIIFLKKKKIDYLLSTGGYMSLPFCIAAKVLGLKIFLFEPNMVLGRSNKLLLRFSKNIFCYHNKIINFPEKFRKKIVLIDRLLRKEIYHADNNQLNTKKFDLKILITGGSQGAFFFDNNIKEIIKKLPEKKTFYLIQQTSNKKNKEEIRKIYDNLEIGYELFTYDEKLYEKLKDVDIAITRAGASIISDLIYFKIPFIAIPLPSSKDNHQYYNARYFSDLGCCWILEQNNSINQNIFNLLISIINDKKEYLIKKKNIEKISSLYNWEKINQKLINSFYENKNS